MKVFCLIILIIFSTARAFAQAPDTLIDPTEISIEELLKTEIIPINVMGSHIHFKGEWMLGYQLMSSGMDDIYQGNKQVGTDSGDGIFPEKMTMEMHMLELMYGFSDKVTIMAMLPFINMQMDMDNDMSMSSRGFGDLQLMAHYLHINRYPHWVVCMMAVDFPTGSINEEDDIGVLPYAMQPGSGSFSITPGINYIHQNEKWNWGLHGMGSFRLNDNDTGYRLGNKYHLTSWITRYIYDWLKISLFLDGYSESKIKASNPAISMMASTGDPANYGGKRLDFGFGLNTFIKNGTLASLRLEVEYSIPLYQNMNGIQLGADNKLRAGVNWTF